MITTKVIERPNNRRLFFQESALAHRYLDGLRGIELGAAAHNHFGLDSINVAPKDDFDFYADNQADMCGQVAQVDLWAEAHSIPAPESSQDYVLTSHVIEHVPDPIGAFREWTRILKDGGLVFMIFPKRDALDSDKTRPITPLADFQRAEREQWTPDTIPFDAEAHSQARRGHYWVFTLQSMQELVLAANLDWELVQAEETDDKVGNGHLLVYRVHKAVKPTLQEVAEEGYREDPTAETEAIPEPKPRRRSKKEQINE